MLTANRPELAKRAVECFRRQTYQRKCLFVLDTTPGAGNRPLLTDPMRGEFTACADPVIPLTIGELRNEANRTSRVVFGGDIVSADILIHWDDDDYSHPNRIAEQVALLQSSGADCVGYNQMLFWRETPILTGDFRRIDGSHGTEYRQPGEAWLYSNPNPGYCLGTSLCYWRKIWERKPFAATNVGEDLQFCTGLKCIGITSYYERPLMIARIHAGNTSTAYKPELMAAIERQGGEWKRSPEWDSYCRGVME